MKFYHVLYPKEKATLLKECKCNVHCASQTERCELFIEFVCVCFCFCFAGDLWGPLILCTFMATVLQGSADGEKDGGPEFAQVFVIVWIGAMIVTLNSKLLGGNM